MTLKWGYLVNERSAICVILDIFRVPSCHTMCSGVLFSDSLACSYNADEQITQTSDAMSITST